MLLNKSIKQLAELLQAKKISSVDLVLESLSRIEKLNPQINSFIKVKEKKELLKIAERLDQSRNKDSSVLHGIPFSLKDAYITRDLQTTAASKILHGFTPKFNATVYQKLIDANSILIGKNNMDAWGHGASNENSDYGAVKNPWDLSRVAVGSSGGSAASIASHMVSFAIGEDTGGSIRNPASFCNISGLKVTYGRVSRYGAIAYASSLDTIGPMAKSVEDLSFILEAIAGKDQLDASSSQQKVDKYSKFLGQDIKNKIIGLPEEFLATSIDPEIKMAIEKAAQELEKLGAKIIPISIPTAKKAISIYYLIAASETSSNLARYDSVRYGQGRSLFSDENCRRIILGTYALSAGYADKLYKNAQKARTLLIQEYEAAFKKCDVLLAPVAPILPTKLGELINNPLQNMLADLYTVTINIVGVPSLAIPAGFSKNKLPIGLQLIGKKFHEGELLQLGYAYQQVTTWHQQPASILKHAK